MTWPRVFPAALRILLALLLFVLLLVLLVPRPAIVTIDARTEEMTFIAADDSSVTRLAQGVLRETLGGQEENVFGTLQIKKGTHVRVVRTGKGPLAIALRRVGQEVSTESVARLNDRPLGSRAWLNIPVDDGNFLLTFAGDFSIGSLVGPTTEAVLLDGSAEIVEKVAFAAENYVNDRLALRPGDYAVTRGHSLDERPVTDPAGSGLDQSPPTGGFVYASPGLSDAGAFHVHAESPPDFVQLTRSPRRPGVRLRPTYWGRIRESSEFAALVVLFGFLGAIAESAGFFLKARSEEERRPDPRPTSPTVAHVRPAVMELQQMPAQTPSTRGSSLTIAAAFVLLMISFARTGMPMPRNQDDDTRA